MRYFLGVVILLLLLLLSFFVPRVAGASAPECQASYEVGRWDTLRSISAQFGITPGELVGANKSLHPPNYVLVAEETLCIPYPGGKESYVPESVLDRRAFYFNVISDGEPVRIVVGGNAKNVPWELRVKNGTAHLKIQKPPREARHDSDAVRDGHPGQPAQKEQPQKDRKGKRR